MLKKGDNKAILTEVDEELLFNDATMTREEFKEVKKYKDDK